MRVNVWTACLRSGGGGILGGGLVTSFVSVHGSKIGVSEGYVGGTLVRIVGGDTGVVLLLQEGDMFDGKEAV